MMYGLSDALKCQAMAMTLIDYTFEWFKQIPEHFWWCYDQFVQMLVDSFAHSRSVLKNSATFFSYKQAPNKSFRAFTERFNQAALQVSNPNNGMAIIAYTQRLGPGEFKKT